MSDHQPKESAATEVLSLYSLLEKIEQEILPAFIADRQFQKRQRGENQEHRIPYVSFQLAGVKMMVPLELIAEVGHLPVVTSLPHLPAWITGIVQLQGEILPVINLLKFFQLDQGRLMLAAKSFLLFSWHDLKMCLEVEKISGVVNIDLQQEVVMPLIQKEKDVFGEMAAYLQGGVSIGGERAYLLNLVEMKNNSSLTSWKAEL